MKSALQSNVPSFVSLNHQDVITSQISDHHPIIHDGVLFWNIMMQGNRRGNGIGYNNGFGIIEQDKDYIKRLIQVAFVIVEAVFKDPSIEIISLCEGPIQPTHVYVLFQAMMQFPFMHRFFRKEKFYKPHEEGFNWGLLMLADKSFRVKPIETDFVKKFPKLVNRLQLWQLENTNEKRYLGLAHFPFAGDEKITEQLSLSSSGQEYCHLMKKLIENYNNEQLTFCADFNFNPYLISAWEDRVLDQIIPNNSILLTAETLKPQITTVTVDGILLSAREKQKYQSLHAENNFSVKLLKEYGIFSSVVKNQCATLLRPNGKNLSEIDRSQPRHYGV